MGPVLCSGSRVRVRINKSEQQAIVSDGSFAVEHGQMAFAPGSSGWKNTGGEATRWIELFLRGGSAWEAFARPSIGDLVEIVGD